MFLKLLSIPELNLQEGWSNGCEKLRNLSFFEKYMTIFWFLGPFIYLIERDPADLWLTTISLTFLYRSYIRSDWEWSKQLWFKFALLLWVVSLVSSLFSPNPLFSISQGFPWIRFPLYAVAAQIWLGQNRDIRVMMFAIIMIGMICLSSILFFEILLEPKSRLTWPYGDAIPGVYLAKLGLLVMCSLYLITLNLLLFTFLLNFNIFSFNIINKLMF